MKITSQIKKDILNLFISSYIDNCYSIIVATLNFQESPLIIINHNDDQREFNIAYLRDHIINDNTIVEVKEYTLDVDSEEIIETILNIVDTVKDSYFFDDIQDELPI